MVAPVTKSKSTSKPKVKVERCARCGEGISRRATPSVWRDHVVCARCHSKLRAIEPAMAICPGAEPVLRYARSASKANPDRPFGGWLRAVRGKITHLF